MTAFTVQWHRYRTLLVPAWALICGFIASGQFSPSQLTPALVTLMIAVGLWPAFWAALAETDWSQPLTRWRNWDQGEPLKPLPYAVPGSDADTLVIVLGKFRAWAIHDLLPNHSNTVAVVIIAPAAALILSAILGAPAVVLTIAAICLAQLAVLLSLGHGIPHPLLRATFDVTLPLLLGYSLLHALTVEVMVVAIGFGVAYAGMSTQRSWTWNAGLGIVLALLIVARHSVGAFGVGLLWLPQLLAQASPSPRHVGWWLHASVFITALTLG